MQWKDKSTSYSFTTITLAHRMCQVSLVLKYSFAFILKRKRELVALLLLSYGCLATVNVL